MARKTTSATSDKSAAKPTRKPRASKPRASRAVKFHKIGRSIGGNDLRVYTVAILTMLGMFKAGTTVPRGLFVGFYMSKSILANHGGNGNLAVTADTVALTAQGRDFFNARIADGLATKTEIAAVVKALKSGKGTDLPERFDAYRKCLYINPACEAK